MFGEPGNSAKQLAVLRETLEALVAIATPGEHRVLPYRWEAPAVMWRGRALVEGAYS
jgi:hypothetical protein